MVLQASELERLEAVVGHLEQGIQHMKRDNQLSSPSSINTSTPMHEQMMHLEEALVKIQTEHIEMFTKMQQEKQLIQAKYDELKQDNSAVVNHKETLHRQLTQRETELEDAQANVKIHQEDLQYVELQLQALWHSGKMDSKPTGSKQAVRIIGFEKEQQQMLTRLNKVCEQCGVYWCVSTELCVWSGSGRYNRQFRAVAAEREAVQRATSYTWEGAGSQSSYSPEAGAAADTVRDGRRGEASGC